MSLRSEMIIDAKLIMRDGLARTSPHAEIDSKGYVRPWEANLLSDVNVSLIEDDLRAGKGSELDWKFGAAHSSAALAVNVFAPFRKGDKTFTLPGLGSLTLDQFERKFSTDLTNRIPPHLDAVAVAKDRLVAIESKCLEYFTPKAAEFSVDYRTLAKCRATPWYDEMERLRSSPLDYQCLDAAQLIKHAFGLINSAPDAATLLYLFWEPEDASYHAMFAEHRQDIAQFSSRVTGGGPEFRAMSYLELWASWRDSPQQFLRVHAERLFERYGGRLGSYEGYSRIKGRKTDVGFFDDDI